MDYIRIKFNPVQLKLIQDLSKRLCELMNISKIAMRGIIWFALREWQMKHNNTIAEITCMPLNERIIAAKEIFNNCKRRMKEMLNEPKDQNELLLDIIFERSFKFFMEYQNRINH